METNYKERYEIAIQKYQQMLKEYEELVGNDRYWEITQGMPLAFLSAAQLCEKLKLLHTLDKKPLTYFSSREEAKVFYKQLTGFRAKSEELLEGASYLAEVGRKADEINQFVESSPYLGEALLLTTDTTVIGLAKECLQSVPEYSKLCTKGIKWNFIESVLASLSKEDVDFFIDAKVILPEDLNHISLLRKEGSYQENLAEVFQKTGKGKPHIKEVPKLKLKGVSFQNKDGVPRQELLKELEEYLSNAPQGEKVPLELEHYIYTPEIGAPEPAIRVLWNGKDIGNLGKDVVADLETKYQSTNCVLTLEKVTGGGKGASYGCEVTLTIYSPEELKETQTEQVK